MDNRHRTMDTLNEKRQRKQFCKSYFLFSFLFRFANLKSSITKTKAESTFSIQQLKILYRLKNRYQKKTTTHVLVWRKVLWSYSDSGSDERYSFTRP